MSVFSVMGVIRLKLRCARFLNWKAAQGLFFPLPWRVRYALARWQTVDRKEKTGGMFYEYPES